MKLPSFLLVIWPRPLAEPCFPSVLARTQYSIQLRDGNIFGDEDLVCLRHFDVIYKEPFQHVYPHFYNLNKREKTTNHPCFQLL